MLKHNRGNLYPLMSKWALDNLKEADCGGRYWIFSEDRQSKVVGKVSEKAADKAEKKEKHAAGKDAVDEVGKM